MGLTNAISMLEADLDLEATIVWHLRHNHYPPVPARMADACLAAIDAANADEWATEVVLPDGVTYRGRSSAPAWVFVELYHLGAFVTD